MTRKRFLQIWIPLAVILAITVFCCTLIMNEYSTLMDLRFGKGRRKVVSLSGSEMKADYYPTELKSAAEAAEYGKQITEEIANEGIVLLKNNGVLPLDKGEYVTPFGYHYVFPNYGPSNGSAKIWSDNRITAEQALEDVYEVNGTVVGKMKNADPEGLTASGYFFKSQVSKFKADVLEYNPEIYNGTEESCFNSTGIVFIGRDGGEGAGADITARPLYDGTPHGAALSVYEKQMLRFSKLNCQKTVVVLNCCNPMELSELISDGELEADAILWIGGTGSAGFKSMADIMTGEICPSGRLTDIYVADSTKNPVYANYGNFYQYTNVQSDPAYQIYDNFLEYEEGIYNGYRYYETAAVVDLDFVYGKVDENGASVTAGEVVYPFGYGLSYSRFEQKITNFQAGGNKISIDVSVKNIGEMAAKDVVQIYYTAPYTSLSKQLGMEKSAVNLAGFAKTNLLEPEEKQTVTISFDKEDLASYCSSRDNGDGTFGCYILEEGQYTVSLRNNSHDVLETCNFTVPETVYYDNANPRNSEKSAQYSSVNTIAATNKFDDMTRYMNEQATVLSRAEWAGTQPKTPENFVAPDYALAVYENNKNFNPATDHVLGDAEGSKIYNPAPVTSGVKNELTVSTMRGVDYDNPAWGEFLDKINYSDTDLYNTLHLGYMQTGEINSVGLPSAQFRDGPLGITVTQNDKEVGATSTHNSYCATPVLAAAFDTELAYKFGEAVAQEALWHSEGDLPISGWYAPGLNVHRGPFGGRYYEYLSEDPLLIGLMGAGIASGAADNGLSVVLKHFAANNQDTARDGLNTWMTEQALREIYLRPYEICIKNAKSQLRYTKEDGEYGVITINAVRGIMTSKNNLGATFCGANYPLVTEILKGEWNFHGMVITDSISGKSGALYSKILRSGVNVLMCMSLNGYAEGLQSETAKNMIRESVHALCYTIANSNAMQGVPPSAVVIYGISPWLAAMITLNVLVVCFIIVMTLITCFAFKKT